jgi:hypothetical protein
MRCSSFSQRFPMGDEAVGGRRSRPHPSTSEPTVVASSASAGSWPPLTRLLRDNGDNRRESLRSFLARPMAPAIVEAIWNDSHRHRGSERPTLASLTSEERSRWREFVPLPRSDRFQGLNRDSRNPYRAKAAPLPLWELVVLFFRILEAGLEMDHGVGLSRFSLHYNGILIAPSPESTVNFHDLRVIRDDRLDVLRPRPVDDHTDIRMWHMVTFRDVLANTDMTGQRIDDLSVSFVLHSSDPNAIVVANRGSTRPFTYPCRSSWNWYSSRRGVHAWTALPSRDGSWGTGRCGELDQPTGRKRANI